ncbi:MAG: ABC transporter ATP-binding protein/permease [Treponema sp.]|jgi:ABC-type transport system involved in cytochrome bd biosynthesis fused ATPase/permease subunit|nr:ABC transporter ATP-binding protein/permease [Treponema sp.]
MLNKRILALCPEWFRDSIKIVVFNWIAMLSNALALFSICRIIQAVFEPLLRVHGFSAGEFRPLPAEASADFGPTLALALPAAALSLGIRMFCTLGSADAAFLAGDRIKGRLRERIFRKLLSLGPAYSVRVSTASAVQLSGEGTDQMEGYLGRYVPQLFYSILAPLTLFGILSRISFRTALVLFLCVPLIPLSIVMVQKIAKKILAKYWSKYTGLGDSFLENLQGLTTLKIYGADGNRHETMNAHAEAFRKATMRVLVMQMNSITVMDLIAWGGTALSIILGLAELRAGNIDPGEALFIILIGSEFFIPMRILGSFFHTAMNGAAAGEKIFSLIDSQAAGPGSRAGSPGLEAAEAVSTSPSLQNGAASPGLRAGKTIGVSNLSFAWEKNRPVLRNISLEIAPGTFFALTGESGSGKSTLAAILSGQAPWYEGSASIGGLEISRTPLKELRETFTLLRHNSYLFAGSIRDNLAMAKSGLRDDEMLSVLEQLGLGEFLAEREGLETRISEGAANISGGQRQRLAAARALLHDTDLYIFDEVASNVDVESGEAIMGAVQALAKKKKTVILITHRLADARKAERIAVLDHGSLISLGSHEDLIREGGIYERMYTQQRELESFA